MNREILFRGKRLDNGEWVCGDLMTKYPHHKGLTIVENGCVYHEVAPETVGQLIDRVFVYGYGGVDPICRGDIIGFPYEGQDIVGWVEVEFGIPIIVSPRLEDGFIYLSEVLEVDEDQAVFTGRWLGNIHDNPELLEVE